MAVYTNVNGVYRETHPSIITDGVSKEILQIHTPIDGVHKKVYDSYVYNANDIVGVEWRCVRISFRYMDSNGNTTDQVDFKISDLSPYNYNIGYQTYGWGIENKITNQYTPPEGTPLVYFYQRSSLSIRCQIIFCMRLWLIISKYPYKIEIGSHSGLREFANNYLKFVIGYRMYNTGTGNGSYLLGYRSNADNTFANPLGNGTTVGNEWKYSGQFSIYFGPFEYDFNFGGGAYYGSRYTSSASFHPQYAYWNGRLLKQSVVIPGIDIS